MKSLAYKVDLILFATPIFLYVLMGFVIKDKGSDVAIMSPTLDDKIVLASVESGGDDLGSFVSQVDVVLPSTVDAAMFFVGQKIIFSQNADIDSILVGVTSNLTTKAEIWKNGIITHTSHLGFMKKVTLGTPYTFRLEMEREKPSNKNSKNRLITHCYQGSSFFGDTGTLVVDMSRFDASLDSVVAVQNFGHITGSRRSLSFSKWEFWNNYKSFD